MILWDNIKTAVKNISLEPAVILYYVSFTMTSINQQNLLLQKVCNPGDTPPLFLKCDSEVETQRVVTYIQTWKAFLLHLGPIFFVLFAGSWSDSHGKRRKPLMYLPLFGQILSDILCLLNVYFWSWSPEIAALSGSVPTALTGWRACFNTGMSCYISDISSVKSRTWRIGLCLGFVFLGVPIGGFLFGGLFQKIGLQGIFVICIVLNSMSLIYLVFSIKENKSLEDSSTLSLWEGIFNIRTIKNSFKTTFASRMGNKRSVVLLMLIAGPITLTPVEGEYSVLYYFLRYKFNWNEVNYGVFAGYKTIVIFFGTLVSMGIFSRLLGISDAVIGMMSSVTLMISSVGFAFASQPWELYVYPIVDFLQGAGLVVVYSIVSKTVESTELGQVNSVIGVADAVFPLVNLPLYTQVYNRTFTQLAGAFFLLSFTYGAIAFVIFGTVVVLTRKQKSTENEDVKMNQGEDKNPTP